MEVRATGPLDSSVMSIRRRRKVQTGEILILVVGAVAVVAWFAWRRFSAAPMWQEFNGARAFEDLQNVVKFGPRPPGSSALEETRRYISMDLAADGIEVWHDKFSAATPAGGIAMTNVIGIVPGDSPSVVAVAGHYDTARLERIRFVGANDGGSSTALLLELARVLALRKNRLTYWVVFFDGEEALKQWSASDSLYGSRHMTEQLEADGRLREIRALVLVDMIGDRHLAILRESNSTPWLSDIVFESARDLGYGRYFEGGEFPVEDDHLPFLRKGVPSVDIIDLTPFKSYHHTAQDTLDKCSPESLGIVGRVIMRTLEQFELRVE